MGRRIIILVVAIAFLAGTASFANVTGIPDLENSWAELPCSGIPGCGGVLFNVPNGMGSAFTDARNLDGQVDLTITLYLRDANNDPVVNFPREDMWLVGMDDIHVINPCPSGTIADADTDVNGETQWVNPLFAGGWTDDGTVVMINGEPLNDPGHPYYLLHNSPDINGDGIVNLSDLGLFAQDYFGSYSFRCDFFYDGLHNLSDIALLAQSMGAACP